MSRLHTYNTNVEWTGNTGQGTKDYNGYKRDFTIGATHKTIIPGSSDPAFLGDYTRYNPEELLLASVSSCHMLWYLHLCAVENIIVISYNDTAHGTMKEYEDGNGEFTNICLNPVVTITDESQVQLAEDIHKKANTMCFIANSLKCSVVHKVKIIIANL